tara:strand:- start:3763 stop:4026 length:264 start_codon:yes stop_codon:yes gene_type:complete
MSKATQLELFPDLKVDTSEFDTFTFNGRYLDEHGKPTNSKASKSITADNLEKAKKIFKKDYSDGIDLLNIRNSQGRYVWIKQGTKQI